MVAVVVEAVEAEVAVDEEVVEAAAEEEAAVVEDSVDAVEAEAVDAADLAEGEAAGEEVDHTSNRRKYTPSFFRFFLYNNIIQNSQTQTYAHGHAFMIS